MNYGIPDWSRLSNQWGICPSRVICPSSSHSVTCPKVQPWIVLWISVGIVIMMRIRAMEFYGFLVASVRLSWKIRHRSSTYREGTSSRRWRLVSDGNGTVHSPISCDRVPNCSQFLVSSNASAVPDTMDLVYIDSVGQYAAPLSPKEVNRVLA